MNFEIGWIAGSNSAQDRPLQYVRSAAQGAIGNKQLVTIPGGILRPGQPVILDVTADGDDLRIAIDLLVISRFSVPCIFVQRSCWFELNPALVEDMEVHLYRDAINIRPIIKKFADALDASKKLESDFSES